ncbi:MAG: hypothetical protein P4L53_00345 [Candidatus Obscuribacterales bacterium]|nr:hypothetical protein [Candidatus Obscuribacterales bacterium]
MKRLFNLAIFVILAGYITCSITFADEQMLNGSASQRQPMNSSVKLMKPVEPNVLQIKAAPRVPVNSNLRITSVAPNAVVPQFKRINALGPDGKPAPMRTPSPVTALKATSATQSDPATNGSSVGTNPAQNGVVNLNPQFQSFKTDTKVQGNQATAQSANWQMKSKAGLLTQPVQSQARSANWSDWYKLVAKTVYDQWVVNETGPGKVCVQVTVWASRDIEGRILRFENAPDSVRTSAQQVNFSKAALQAVNSLENNGILEFPVNDHRTKIVFELDISRLVGGASGCQVVNAHTEN